MAAVLVPVVLLAGWNESEGHRGTVRQYLVLTLISLSMMVGVFAAIDVFLFYVFFEAILIPMYFLIGRFGGARATYAAVKFLLYNLFGGLIMLAAVIGLYVATAGSDDKCRACEDLGAERCFNYKSDDFVEEAKKLGGFDLILDMVGGPYLPRNVRALADDGRLVQIAFLQGAKVELNFAEMMMRRLTLTGSTLRPQSDQAKARIAAAVEANVWPMIAKGAFRVVIDSEYPLTEAPAAHWRLESSGHIGKIVMKVES